MINPCMYGKKKKNIITSFPSSVSGIYFFKQSTHKRTMNFHEALTFIQFAVRFILIPHFVFTTTECSSFGRTQRFCDLHYWIARAFLKKEWATKSLHTIRNCREIVSGTETSSCMLFLLNVLYGLPFYVATWNVTIQLKLTSPVRDSRNLSKSPPFWVTWG